MLSRKRLAQAPANVRVGRKPMLLSRNAGGNMPKRLAERKRTRPDIKLGLLSISAFATSDGVHRRRRIERRVRAAQQSQQFAVQIESTDRDEIDHRHADALS